MSIHDEQVWYKIGFDEACLAGRKPNPPVGRSNRDHNAYNKGFADRRALDVGGEKSA